MTTFRIKEITTYTGGSWFVVQKKNWLGWSNFYYQNDAYNLIEAKYVSKEDAEKCIARQKFKPAITIHEV